jgi:hypothetical protein
MVDSHSAARVSLHHERAWKIERPAVVLALLLSMVILFGPVPRLPGPSQALSDPHSFIATAGSGRTLPAAWTCYTCGRTEQAVVYDSTDGYLVAFGGLVPLGPDPQYVDNNQTWIYEHRHWSLLNTTSAPSARFGATLVDDPTDGYVLLFGGMTNYSWTKLGMGGYSTSYSLLNDSWKFSHGNWTRLSPTIAPPRQGTGPGYDPSNAAAYDGADKYVVLIQTVSVGNSPSTYGYNTTSWKFANGQWSSLAVNVQPRACFGLEAYDSAAQQVLLTGLDCTNGGVGEESTWTYAAGNWANSTSSASWVPYLGATQSLSDDPANGGVLSFGGYNFHNGTVNNVTREFRAGKWVNLTLTHAPPPMQDAWSVFDPKSNSTLLLWGENIRGLLNPLDDVWSLSQGTWSNTTATAPSARYGAGVADDPALGVLVLFGGTGGGRMRNDTWTYASGIWTRLNTPTAPSARTGFAFAYDRATRSVVLFGGHATSYFNDTWSFANGTWTQLSVRNAPPAREYASMEYDSTDGSLVLFGGTNGGFLGDTWVFTHGGWTNVTSRSSNAPSPRYGASIGEDQSDGHLVLFGGFNGRYLADTWTYQNQTWSLRPTLTNPTGRVFAGMTYDSATSELVLFGGYDGKFLGDTWTFASGAWTRSPLKLSPPSRELAALVYSATSGSVDLFGGLGASGRVLNDDWSL